MPLPLIPIGITIGTGAVSAIGSITAGRRRRRDQRRYDERRETYASNYESYQIFARRAQGKLDDLHLQRVAAVKTLRKAAKFLVRANVKERDWDVPNITPEQFAEIEDVVASLGDTAARLGFSYAGSGIAGAGAAAGAYAAASAFGTASTGAAISGLAGAAARNATLAWLGGGSLAAGGGGMAAGVASLTGISLVPLAIIPPMVEWAQALRQSRRINKKIADMDVHEAEFGRHKVELTAVIERAREMSEAVGNAEWALKDTLRRATGWRRFWAWLLKIILRRELPDKLEAVHRVAILAKALADILDQDARMAAGVAPIARRTT